MVRNVLELFLNILLWLFVCISLPWLPWVSFWILTEKLLAQCFTGRRKDKKVLLRQLCFCLIWTALLPDSLLNTDFKLCGSRLAWVCFDSWSPHINLLLVKTNRKEWKCSHAMWGHGHLRIVTISPLLTRSFRAPSGHTADEELNMKLAERANYAVAKNKSCSLLHLCTDDGFGVSLVGSWV